MSPPTLLWKSTVSRIPPFVIAEVMICCAVCGVPFHFCGLPHGLDMSGAAVSIDGTEARLSIAPGENFGPGQTATFTKMDA